MQGNDWSRSRALAFWTLVSLKVAVVAVAFAFAMHTLICR